MIKYKAKGYCSGNLWGGGVCGYPTKSYESDSLDDLKKQLNDGLANGSLDSGMGFESLRAFMVEIDTQTTIEIEGKLFSNSEYDIYSEGLVIDFEFLLECINQY